jgi:beta-phosphoglucomutase-like phosphatase (HAD superfamily)
MADLNSSSSDLIIFDCDGVLVDSEPIYTSMLMEMFAQAALVLSYEEVVENSVGKSLKSNIAFAEGRLGKTAAVDFSDLESKTREAFRLKLKPVAGVSEALAASHNKYVSLPAAAMSELISY